MKRTFHYIEEDLYIFLYIQLMSWALQPVFICLYIKYIYSINTYHRYGEGGNINMETSAFKVLKNYNEQ